MARYRGPKAKIARRFREPIFGPSKALERKKFGPGQHGRNLFVKATRRKGVTGEIFLQLLESRLDNTIYRMGIAATRRQARQLVTHKHITVNGDVVNIASMLLRPGDVLEVRVKSKALEIVKGGSRNSFPWLQVDNMALKGSFLQYPEREQIPENIKENLIVELYSK